MARHTLLRQILLDNYYLLYTLNYGRIQTQNHPRPPLLLPRRVPRVTAATPRRFAVPGLADSLLQPPAAAARPHRARLSTLAVSPLSTTSLSNFTWSNSLINRPPNADRVLPSASTYSLRPSTVVWTTSKLQMPLAPLHPPSSSLLGGLRNSFPRSVSGTTWNYSGRSTSPPSARPSPALARHL